MQNSPKLLSSNLCSLDFFIFLDAFLANLSFGRNFVVHLIAAEKRLTAEATSFWGFIRSQPATV